MIENDKQLEITKEQSERFSVSIEKLKKEKANFPPKLYKIQMDALTAQKNDLIQQIIDYENSKKKK